MVPGDDDLVACPQGESDAYAASLLPMKGSEDARKLLAVKFPPAGPEPDFESLLYDAALDWLVEIPLASPVPTGRLDKLFDKAWRIKFGSADLQGKDGSSGAWTFAHCGERPAAFSELRIAYKLFDSSAESPRAPSARQLDSFLVDLLPRAKAAGASTIRAKQRSADAAARATELQRIWKSLSGYAEIRVAAPQGTSFEGKVIWDVMMSLGMHWGDMDLFHWENDGLTTGHDHLFSVMTSTRPGYFLPDRIAAGKVRVADLIFGFSIARSGAPELVAGAMVRAADYAAKRLGGLLEMPGRPFVQPAFLAEVARLSRELTASGFPPGAPRTMRLF